jgi:ketosteroid isomerase-like protein
MGAMKAIGLILLLGSLMGRADTPTEARKAIESSLDRFHEAAAKADGKTYFGLFAPEGIFIGTDASERWTVEQFRKYAEPHFSKGKGWKYAPKTRHVDISPGGDTAWFDEILENASYGTCRGSGVLRKTDAGWKIAQYHLTIPVPNELADQVVALIRKRK